MYKAFCMCLLVRRSSFAVILMVMIVNIYIFYYQISTAEQFRYKSWYNNVEIKPMPFDFDIIFS